MPTSSNNTSSGRQVELVIRQLNSLSTLPEVAVQFLSQLGGSRPGLAELADIVEADPALTARIFSVAYQQRVNFPKDKPSIQFALSVLPASAIRDAVLSVKVFHGFDVNDDPDSERTLPRKQLWLHGLAVGCCARDIAEQLPDVDEQIAFSAGLLHDIGKLALDEVMPKSFQRIAEQAKSRNVSMRDVEQENLGIDHTIIGKRLAEKWHLPKVIINAIWLHHSDIEAISAQMPEAIVGSVVRLADIIARQCGLGQSGSCDNTESVDSLARFLGLNQTQIEHIRSRLADEVLQKSRLLGLDSHDAYSAYCDAVHDTTCRLSGEASRLSEQNLQLTLDSTYLNFINQFLESINPDAQAIDIAADFATRWQKFYQTGPVCVYLAEASREKLIEAVVVDDSSQAKTILIKAPEDLQIIPTEIQNNCDILNACESTAWLFNELDVDFDSDRTKLIPLLANGRAIAGLVFELRLQAGQAELASTYSTCAGVGGNVLALSVAHEQQERLCEQFAGLVDKLKRSQEQIVSAKSLLSLAEIAAGAAHELNNPLAVISGRAQLLTDVETDPQKQQVLEQIKARAGEMSQIVGDLMDFAKPQAPVQRPVSLQEVVNECIGKTAKKHTLSALEVRLKGFEGLKEIYVDPGQIATAICNILSNALESYNGGSGPIEIIATYEEISGSVVLQIIDFGCGMDAETLNKAIEPFFSAKAAGRQRGMGLAHAQRLIHQNSGSMRLESKPDSGTTVTIIFSCK